MKAARFEYVRARSAEHAVELLADDERFAKVISGGQSLGPMLNLRIAQPDRLIDISQCADLRGYAREPEAIVYGAAVTHADIEDGRVPDVSGGFLAAAARKLAYRAVRNRGTIGGSLAHADPAADWITVLMALEAEVIVRGADGLRAERLATFVLGPFLTSLAPTEIVIGVRVREPGPTVRLGYCKLAAKTGEFAQALSVARLDTKAGTARAVVGAIERAPVMLDQPDLASRSRPALEALIRPLHPHATPAQLRMHAAATRRALDDAAGTTTRQEVA